MKPSFRQGRFTCQGFNECVLKTNPFKGKYCVPYLQRCVSHKKRLPSTSRKVYLFIGLARTHTHVPNLILNVWGKYITCRLLPGENDLSGENDLLTVSSKIKCSVKGKKISLSTWAIFGCVWEMVCVVHVQYHNSTNLNPWSPYTRIRNPDRQLLILFIITG